MPLRLHAPTRVSLMETDAQILILLDVSKWLSDGGQLFYSENNVILSPDFNGVVPPKYFRTVWQIRPHGCMTS